MFASVYFLKVLFASKIEVGKGKGVLDVFFILYYL